MFEYVLTVDSPEEAVQCLIKELERRLANVKAAEVRPTQKAQFYKNGQIHTLENLIGFLKDIKVETPKGDT